MSRTIPHRELWNNISAVLRDVAAGETISITNHGAVVAILVPPGGRERPSLPVRPAAVIGGFAELVRTTLDHPIQQTLDDLRGDR